MADLIRRDIRFFDSLASTNLYCLENAAELPSGTMVVADTQTAGRGRRGRCWISPPGVNLYASLYLSAPDLDRPHVEFVQIMSLAIYNTLQSSYTGRSRIKWPNDIVIGKHKVAGILTECTTAGGLVIGFGVNLNMTQAALDQIDQPATSVSIESRTNVDRDTFLMSVIGFFEACYFESRLYGSEAVHDAWTAASCLVDRHVSIRSEPDPPVSGVVTGFDRDSALLMRTASGEIQRFINGDVTLRLE